MSAPDTRRIAAAIWRIESPRLIATLSRLLRSVPLAEEVVQRWTTWWATTCCGSCSSLVTPCSRASHASHRLLWDPLLVRRGLDALRRAEALATRPGPYLLQAAIAACHARASSVSQTDWARVVALYTALAHLTPSPIIELNRAVAASRAFGPEAGLAIADPLQSDPALAHYPFLPSVRADLLAKLGRFGEARSEVERAASLTKNQRERAMFLERAERYRRERE